MIIYIRGRFDSGETLLYTPRRPYTPAALVSMRARIYIYIYIYIEGKDASVCVCVSVYSTSSNSIYYAEKGMGFFYFFSRYTTDT